MNIQIVIAIISFLAAIIFAIAGFCVPPEGEVHESVLYLIAQFLLLTATILGFKTSPLFHGIESQEKAPKVPLLSDVPPHKSNK